MRQNFILPGPLSLVREPRAASVSANLKEGQGISSGRLYLQHGLAVLKLALPIAATEIAELAMIGTDLAIVGRLGRTSLAAVGLAGTLTSNFIVVSSAIIAIVGIMVASAGARNDSVALHRYGTQGLWLTVLIATVVSFMMWFMGRWIVFLGQNQKIVPVVVAYTHALIWALWPALLFVWGRTCLWTTRGKMTAGVITAFAVPVNFILDYALVFGHLGLPALGVTGAGYATAIVNLLMSFALALAVLREQHWVLPPLWRGIVWPDLPVLGTMLRHGIPMGGTTALEYSMFAIVTVMMGTISVTALAAQSVVVVVLELGLLLAIGIGEATAIRVSTSLSEGRPDTGRRIVRSALAMTTIYMACFALILVFAGERLARIFIPSGTADQAAVIALASKIFMVAALFQMFDGGQVVLFRAMRGYRDTSVPFWIAVAGFWGIGLGCAYFMGFVAGFGAVGLWCGLAVGLAVTAGAMLMRARRTLSHSSRGSVLLEG